MTDKRTKADSARIRRALPRLATMKPGFVPPVYATLGERVRVVREALGMPQEKLAELVGIGRTSIVNFENGRQACPLHTILDMAHAMKLKPANLFKDIL